MTKGRSSLSAPSSRSSHLSAGDPADWGRSITTEAQLSNWLSTNWFPNATPTQIKQILINYPQDVTKGVSWL